jgi:hypothetical protein
MDRSCICNVNSVLPAEAYVPARKGVAWQGRMLRESYGPAPDVMYTGPDDLREGGETRSSQPSIGSIILSPKGWRCTPEHFVFCGTYSDRRQEYSAVVTCHVTIA